MFQAPGCSGKQADLVLPSRTHRWEVTLSTWARERKREVTRPRSEGTQAEGLSPGRQHTCATRASEPSIPKTSVRTVRHGAQRPVSPVT